MKKLGIMIIALAMLVTGFAMAGICPFDPDESPSELSVGYTTGSITTVGSVNGFASYTGTQFIGGNTSVTSSSVYTQKASGMGVITLATDNTVTSDGISGTMAGMVGGGRLYVSDTVMTRASSITANGTDETDVVPYCDRFMSKATADLTKGEVGTVTIVTPITVSGGIAHSIGVDGTGSVSAYSGMKSINGCGNVTSVLRSKDAVHFSGTDLVFGRDVKFSSLR